jgi:hypothetical protein
MKFRLLNVMAAISLVLCVATISAWVLSTQRADVIGAEADHSFIAAQSQGSILFGTGCLLDDNTSLHHRIEARLPIWNFAWGYVYGDMGDFIWLHGGFGFAREYYETINAQNWCLVFPHWSMVILTAILPSILVYRLWRGKHKLIRGFCFACGYDLRATPDRCPECGSVPENVSG